MAEYPAGEISRAGEKIRLRVDDGGNWLATTVGRDLKAPTRDKLITEIERALRLVKKAVHVPFTHVESKNNGYVTLKHGVATGIHSGTGNLLVAWDDGSNGQLNTGGTFTDVLRRLTKSEESELRDLAKTAYESGEALRNFLGRRQVYKGAKGLIEQVETELKKGGGR